MVVALLIGLAIGWFVGWRLTRRSYSKLVSAIDEQNARLLSERRESRAEADRIKRMLGRADKAITNAKTKRDQQAQIIIDLTDSAGAGSVSAEPVSSSSSEATAA